MASNLTIPFKSQRVCSNCRKWKKQCDKTIPRCSRCVRKSILCDYTAPIDNHFIHNHRPRPNLAATTNIVELRADCCPPGLTEVGWSLLLEIACSSVDMRGEATTLSAVIRKVLEDSGTNPSDATSKFVATIYPWFPILNQATLTRLIDWSENENPDGSLAFLLLCMHILNQWPCQHQPRMTDNSLYIAARRLFFFLQDTVNPSPEELLQAGILITLYECSHGIWNAAYVTLANCIALSQLAGASYVDNFSSHDNTMENTSYWGIILLDRLISLLNPDNPRPSLIAYNESQHDMSWLGQLGSLAAADESFSDFPGLVKFHVTAQTAYNVGDALRYIANPGGVFATTQWFNLTDSSTTKIVNKLLLISQDQPLRLCDATSFAISVLVSLRRTDHLEKPLETQVNSAKVLSLNSSLNMVHEIVRTTTKSTTDKHIGDHSFIGIVSVLRAGIYLAMIRGQSLDIKDWDEIEALLLPFSKRWGVGVQLLKEFTQHKQATWPEASS
ncbi:hypothetical protein F4803DRAFT_540088 [Xylaria telfairii]|nr:hypothetical protein F4803DRAFT_540088 [Xylaria telfairii]